MISALTVIAVILTYTEQKAGAFPPKIKIQFPEKETVFLVGAAGFGPTRCRSQSPVPYRLATPQY